MPSPNLIARIEPEIRFAMDAYKEIDGVPITVQVNKALAAYLSVKGWYDEIAGKALPGASRATINSLRRKQSRPSTKRAAVKRRK